MKKGLLEKRYPGLEFLLRLPHEEKSTFEWGGHETQQSVAQSLEDVETVFVYGVGSGAYFDLFKKWLDQHIVRELVFIEDELIAISNLEKMKRFDPIFRHSRCHLLPLMPGADLDELAFEAAKAHPSIKVAVFAIHPYMQKKREKFDRLKEALLRACVLVDSMNKESLYHHQLFKNLLENYKRIPGSFFANRLKNQFEGIPAIICGAGPSLQGSIDTLHRLQNRALIFAGGSTIAALNHHGIEPHFACAVDPNPNEWNCLQRNSSFETPFLYASRLLPKVFESVNGPRGYVQTFTGGPSEHLMEEELGLLGQELEEQIDINGMSVTTMAISLAVAYGCDPIILCGTDLAYTDRKRYAEGVMSESVNEKFAQTTSVRADEQPFVRNGVETLTKWIMEADWVSQKAKREKARFINCTPKGLGFEGIIKEDLKVVADHYLTRQFDLKGPIWCSIQNSMIDSEKIDLVEKTLKTLKSSLTEISHLLDQIHALYASTKRLDHPRALLLEMDLKEEFAYKKLLGNIEEHVVYTVMRASERVDCFTSERKQKKAHFECAIKSNRYMAKIVSEYLLILKDS